MIWRSPVSIVNARVVADGGEAESVRFTGCVTAIGARPSNGDVVVDARGAFVLPGLINAHDHLELNHYGRLKFRERYGNVSEWIDDMRPRLAADAAIRDGRSRPLSDRLFVGALKNLLSGVTTVVHHNPFYRELRRGMPIRVLRRYGWAHSLGLQGHAAGAKGEAAGDVQDRFRATAADTPFFVHVGEGVDERARAECATLDALGCLAPNTVLIHGTAIDPDGWRRVARARASVTWCPASNVFLFGRTIDVAAPSHASAAVVLGTDSRLTGSRDLLDELRAAHEACPAARDALLAMVTSTGAAVIRQPQLGRIAVGAPADLVVVPAVAPTPVEALLAQRREDLSLVVVGGTPRVAAEHMAAVFGASGAEPRSIRVDGAVKLADPWLARRTAECAIAEPGVAA